MDVKTLSKITLFSKLDESELARIAGTATRLDKPAGSRLFACGDASDSFYLIEAGAVRIHIPPTSVDEARTVTLTDGTFFGEMGLLRGKPRMADAEVERDARLLRIDKARFDELMAAEPKIAEKVTRAYKDRLESFRRSDEAAARALEDPRLLVFLSTGGHEGATFLCANLGSKLQEVTGRSTLVVDLNFGNPMLQRYVGALSDTGTFSRIFEADEITPTLIRRCAANVGNGVHLLAGGGTGSIVLTPRHVEELMPELRKAYDYVLVDAGRGAGTLDEAVVRFADIVHIVVTPTRASLDRAKPLVEALKTLGLAGRIRLVVNKVPDKPEIDPAKIEGIVGAEVLGAVAFSPLQAERGARTSAPVVKTHGRSQVSTEFSALARAVFAQPKGPLERIRDLVVWALFGGD